MAKWIPERFLISLLLLALLSGGLLSACTATDAETAAAEEAAVQTTTVRRGDISITATGAGTVIPAAEVSLGFAGSGTLAEVAVRVGDVVAAGDVLARLDATDAAQAVAEAELQLAQSVLQTDGSATQTGISFSDIAVEQARISLDEAQAELDDLLNWQPDADEIALAQAQLDAAQASYQAALGQSAASSNNVQVSAISLEQAQRSLDDAQAAYDTAFDPGREWELTDPRRATQLENERNAAENALQRAQDNLTIAQLDYNGTVAGSASGSVAGARTNVVSAEQALVAAQTGPTDDAIDLARKALRSAELSHQQALLNQEADGLSLRQAQMARDAAEQALAETVLTAPLAGTVTSISASPGESVSGTFITLADLSRPMLEVYVDETDLDKVALDYPAEVVFDAFPDETFSGAIVEVDPSITTTSGVSAVRAVVRLDYNRPQTLPAGLNATVDIIGGEATNALLVPLEALREISPGQFMVFVMRDGAPVLTPVEIGLTNFAFAEILSGLAQGDVVTTGVVETQ